MTTYPEPARPTPVPACTVMDFASRLGISRRAALDLFGVAAAHLGVVVREADSNRLTVTATDFSRMVALVETLNSVGLTIRQLRRIQQCQNPELWALLQGPRAAAVAVPVVDHHTESRSADAAVERIEMILVDHLARQETLVRQHLSRLVPVHYLPAPLPTPVRIRENQAEPMPVPVPARAPSRGLNNRPEHGPAPTRVVPTIHLEDHSED